MAPVRTNKHRTLSTLPVAGTIDANVHIICVARRIKSRPVDKKAVTKEAKWGGANKRGNN